MELHTARSCTGTEHGVEVHHISHEVAPPYLGGRGGVGGGGRGG